MSDVKRYRIDSFLGYDPNGPYSSWEEEEDSEGKYVLATDYDALKAERDAARAELAAVRAAVRAGAVSDEMVRQVLGVYFRHSAGARMWAYDNWDHFRSIYGYEAACHEERMRAALQSALGQTKP